MKKWHDVLIGVLFMALCVEICVFAESIYTQEFRPFVVVTIENNQVQKITFPARSYRPWPLPKQPEKVVARGEHEFDYMIDLVVKNQMNPDKWFFRRNGIVHFYDQSGMQYNLHWKQFLQAIPSFKG